MQNIPIRDNIFTSFFKRKKLFVRHQKNIAVFASSIRSVLTLHNRLKYYVWHFIVADRQAIAEHPRLKKPKCLISKRSTKLKMFKTLCKRVYVDAAKVDVIIWYKLLANMFCIPFGVSSAYQSRRRPVARDSVFYLLKPLTLLLTNIEVSHFYDGICFSSGRLSTTSTFDFHNFLFVSPIYRI